MPPARKRNFPAVNDIDWLDESDFENRPPRMVVLHADETVEPVAD